MKSRLILSFICLAVFGIAQAQSLESPNGDLEMNFSLQEDGTPVYSLDFEGETVIEKSKLGLELKEGQPLTSNFSIENTEKSSFDETWTPVWGEESEIRNRYNELVIHLDQEDTERKMVIRFRLFNDGLGFRYEFPQESSLGIS